MECCLPTLKLPLWQKKKYVYIEKDSCCSKNNFHVCVVYNYCNSVFLQLGLHRYPLVGSRKSYWILKNCKPTPPMSKRLHKLEWATDISKLEFYHLTHTWKKKNFLVVEFTQKVTRKKNKKGLTLTLNCSWKFSWIYEVFGVHKDRLRKKGENGRNL